MILDENAPKLNANPVLTTAKDHGDLSSLSAFEKFKALPTHPDKTVSDAGEMTQRLIDAPDQTVL